MNTLILFQLVVLSAFIEYIFYLNKGIPESISESFRILQKKFGENSFKPYLFWLFLINISWPIHAMIDTVWSFWAMAGICIVGAAPKFWKGGHETTVHVVGATAGILFGFIAIGASFGGWAWSWIAPQLFGIGLFNMKIWNRIEPPGYYPHEYKGKIKNIIFWTEMLAIFLIILAEQIYV